MYDSSRVCSNVESEQKKKNYIIQISVYTLRHKSADHYTN